ncbi:fimbrial protein [Enterobacter quasiroggenkampii]|uniref:fimbrial protein n=1 Tax=Enterobacter quasiroggenkampii TaxID=2497436 RepID=UPI0021D3220B|nr:fimbrial protein [Enterobacter quasiroggenkampii]MCU6396988.1 fimbrial protein [Enterobacter quasiroggenkampii]
MDIIKTLGLVLCILSLGTPFLCVPLNAANITSTQFTISGVFEVKTCSFNETTLIIDLPEVDTRSLNNTNAIQGKTDFTLSMNCSEGITSVSITPSGTAVSSGDTTLFLNTGSADNIGLRLLDSKGNILNPNNQDMIAIDYEESGGKYTFSAGYSATGTGRVSGGSFQTVVSFLLNYS